MATSSTCRALVSFMVVLVLTVSADDDFAPSPKTDTLNIKNNCGYRVAPAIIPKPGSPPLGFTPVELKGYEYALGIPLPHGWSGRIWGRTGCSTDGSGRFICATGDCGSGRLGCDGGGGGPVPAATVAEFALGGEGGTDAYGISLADGYNLPMLVTPYDTDQGGGHCAPTRCVVDLNGGACPPDQQVKAPGGRVVACKAGKSESLKSSCPEANSYAAVGDAAAASGGFSCAVVDNTYTVTFCPDNSEFDPK